MSMRSASGLPVEKTILSRSVPRALVGTQVRHCSLREPIFSAAECPLMLILVSVGGVTDAEGAGAEEGVLFLALGLAAPRR